MEEKKEGDIVIYKTFWGKKVGIINKFLGNNLYLIDNYFWRENDNKIKYCIVVKCNDILN